MKLQKLYTNSMNHSSNEQNTIKTLNGLNLPTFSDTEMKLSNTSIT